MAYLTLEDLPPWMKKWRGGAAGDWGDGDWLTKGVFVRYKDQDLGRHGTAASFRSSPGGGSGSGAGEDERAPKRPRPGEGDGEGGATASSSSSGDARASGALGLRSNETAKLAAEGFGS